MSTDHSPPLVGIVMGSDSDLETMQGAAAVLDEFDVAYEMRILSAHRTPAAAQAFAESASERGMKVLIAGAGMAAHLAGVLAAHTTLPLIGVPLAGGPLNGLDALYATVQMPSGVPVATVAVDGAKNAAFLAVQILALNDERLAAALRRHREGQTRAVAEKDAALRERRRASAVR